MKRNQPKRLNIGSGKNFRADCLNLDVDKTWGPDLVYDLNLPFPEGETGVFQTRRFGEIEIKEGCFHRVFASDVLEHVPNLPVCMTSVLYVLRPGGIFDIQVPYDLSFGAWQDPTHIRGFNERSWLYYTDWFWYLGWEKYRFKTRSMQFVLSPLGRQLQSGGMDSQTLLRTPRAVDSMNVRLEKIPLSEKDRMTLASFRRSQSEKKDFCIWVVTPKDYPHSPTFDEIAQALVGGFRELGYDVPLVRDPAQVEGVAVVLGANFIPKMKLPSLPRNLILFNLEQAQKDSPWFGPEYLELLNSCPVWDYSRQNMASLQEMGVNDVQLCSVGYAKTLTRIVHEEVKDIDVLFYGSLNQRRSRILSDLQAKGVVVKHLFGVYGRERDAFIARSRIVLNIHYYEVQVFEIVRVSYLLANRVFVVSETGREKEMETVFSHGMVFCAYDDLADTCVRYLEQDMEREKIAEKGFEIMRSRPQSGFLKDVLGFDGEGS